MKKVGIVLTTIIALVAIVAMSAAPALASPSKNRSCSDCHGYSTAITIKVTKLSSTSSSVKYKVAVTGGKGKAGWAVLRGGKNTARRTASTGTFSVPVGKSFRVWAVKTSTGARYRFYRSTR